MTTRADLVTQLKATLGQATTRFTDPDDFQRLLDAALPDLNDARPRRSSEGVELVADQARYPAPAGTIRTGGHAWGEITHKPWQPGYVGTPPRLHVEWTGEQAELVFTPAPTAAQIQQWGKWCMYSAIRAHEVSDAIVTISPADQRLLILRAAAEAMLELAASGVVDPIQMHRGMGSVPANGTPAALADQLLDEYRRRARSWA